LSAHINSWWRSQNQGNHSSAPQDRSHAGSGFKVLLSSTCYSQCCASVLIRSTRVAACIFRQTGYWHPAWKFIVVTVWSVRGNKFTATHWFVYFMILMPLLMTYRNFRRCCW
jgi:hypothetical protein